MVRRAAHPLRAGALALSAALALTALAGAQEADPWQDAYARVDGVAILRTAVDAEAKRGLPKAQALQRMMTLQVMRAGLSRAGRSPARVSEEDLDAAVAEAAEALKAQGQSLEAILKRAGQSRAEFREDLRVPLAFRDLIRAEIGEDAVRKAYEEQRYLLAGEARISHLLVAVQEGRSRTQARARAQELLRGLGKEASLDAFADLATKHSDEAMASLTGGDLDWARAGERRRDLEPAVVRAALARGAKGLVPEPIDGQRGVHLVFVSDLRLPESASLERYAERIRAELERAEAQRRLLAWRERARIEYAPDAPRMRRRAPGSLQAPR